MTRRLQPLGGLHWDDRSCDIEVYLINGTLDGLSCKLSWSSSPKGRMFNWVKAAWEPPRCLSGVFKS